MGPSAVLGDFPNGASEQGNCPHTLRLPFLLGELSPKRWGPATTATHQTD